MGKDEWIYDLFRSIDACDTKTFLSFLSDNVCFQFGNAQPVVGKEAVGNTVQGFFESIHGLKHELADVWEQNNAAICHGTVTYTRHDSSMLSVPFANIFKLEGSQPLVKEYLIFVDVSELYAASQ